MKKTITVFIFAGLALILVFTAVYLYRPNNEVLPTYFTYSKNDLEVLRTLSSSQEIKQATLAKWDTIMFDLVKSHRLGDAYAARIYAYVYTAQRDAAFLSYNVKHSFMGSIEPITANVLCFFFADSCTTIKAQIKSINNDKYSNTVSHLVMNNIENRVKNDNKQTHVYKEPESNTPHWVGVKPYYGQEVGSWKPWLIKSGQEFVAPPPPPYNSVEWETQKKLVMQAVKHITPEQINEVIFWAGNPNTITPPGIWLTFANDYMRLHDTNLEKALYIRSILAMGITDSLITVFNSKYTYWVQRPFMLIHPLETIMPTPNHPSYPAGHSMLSATAATILTYFFPENKDEWNKLSLTASNGRVWGGIHFPIDAKEGALLGTKVGEAIIKQLPTDKK